MLVGLDNNVTSCTAININAKEKTKHEGRECSLLTSTSLAMKVRNVQLDLWPQLSDTNNLIGLRQAGSVCSKALQLLFISDTKNDECAFKGSVHSNYKGIQYFHLFFVFLLLVKFLLQTRLVLFPSFRDTVSMSSVSTSTEVNRTNRRVSLIESCYKYKLIKTFFGVFWIIQINWESVSGKRCCCWILKCHFFMLWAEQTKPQSSPESTWLRTSSGE